MRPGKRQRLALQQQREQGKLSQQDYVRRTRDPSRAMRQRKSGSKLHPKVYNEFKSWIATQIGYMPRKIKFHKKSDTNSGPSRVNVISVSSGEEDDTKYDHQIDTDRLLKGEMLNDEIVNEYIRLIYKRNSAFTSLPNLFVFNSFLLNSLESHGTKFISNTAKNLVDFDEALIPICKKNHWFLLHLLLEARVIRVYDSWTNYNVEANNKSLDDCTNKIKCLLSLVYPDGKPWKTDIVVDIPMQPQLDTRSCGVFILQYAEHISRRASMNFSIDHIPDLRRTMAIEIKENQLKQRYSETEFGPPHRKVILEDTNQKRNDKDVKEDETEEAVANLLKTTAEDRDFEDSDEDQDSEDRCWKRL